MGNQTKPCLRSWERFFLNLSIGFFPPVAFLIVGWWGSIPFVSEGLIPYFAIGGLLLGILMDRVFLRKWVRQALSMSWIWPVLEYFFYSVCAFGFFMGVPLPNFALGPLAGMYVGLRIRSTEERERQLITRQASVFTAAVLFFFCAASLLIASLDAYLEANIQGLLGLRHPLTRGLILLIAAAAGLLLVWIEYHVTLHIVKIVSGATLPPKDK